jgi:hypothetical protein
MTLGAGRRTPESLVVPRAGLAGVLVATSLAACGRDESRSASASDGVDVGECPDVEGDATLAASALPPPGVSFDYQLGGAYDAPAGVAVVVRDREEAPAPGLYGICYINAFQTQPESDWSGDRAGLLLRDGSGLFEDPSWPDEYLFDLSTVDRREQLASIVGEWLAECAADGYDAVELDNLDTFTRIAGAFGLAETAAYAALLLRRAHQSGLAVAQKNTAEASACFRQLGFDFAIAEECWEQGECDAYTAAYGERVFDIEYSADGFEAGCRARRPPAPIRRDRALEPPGPDHVREQCP